MVGTLLLLLVVLAVGTIVWVETRDLLAGKLSADHTGGQSSLPFLIVPVSTGGGAGAPPIPHLGAPVPTKGGGPPSDGPADHAFAGTGGDGTGEESTATVAFRRVADEPVQLLPGRLEVIAGEPGRDEIRFLGMLGERAEFMMGRTAEQSQHVVTLQSPTVSRRHAKMIFARGRWTITNLSSTNPVLVNDAPLTDDEGGARLLEDGDRIELGEVVFRFRER